jgi:hypothetical protein
LRKHEVPGEAVAKVKVKEDARAKAVVKASVAQVRRVAKADQRLPADVKDSQSDPAAANPEIRITRYFQQGGPMAAFFLFNQYIGEN